MLLTVVQARVSLMREDGRRCLMNSNLAITLLFSSDIMIQSLHLIVIQIQAQHLMQTWNDLLMRQEQRELHQY